jgi:hypothetical protein
MNTHPQDALWQAVMAEIEQGHANERTPGRV